MTDTRGTGESERWSIQLSQGTPKKYVALKLLEKAIELGHIVNCDEFKVCYWCDSTYSWSDNECSHHEPDCVWLMVESMNKGV